MGYQVAIDGPAGAGKSTIAKLVAKEKGYIYVDTGALYRALAVCFLDAGILTGDPDEVLTDEVMDQITQACQDADIEVRYEDGQQQVYLDGVNITGRLREEAVGNLSSRCAALPQVREKLLDLQRELARTYDVVMDGRDIATCILPDADVKIFLTASPRVRAGRRYKELQEKGQSCDLEEIEKDIIARDERDMNREISPLVQAEDAVLIDSSDMSIPDVVEAITSLCK